MSKADKAKELFECGCNCCQAVFCAFLEETNLTEEEAMRLSAGFGGGMGRMREVCGAVSGSFMILGLTEKYTDPADSEGKMALYAKVREIADKFKAENGSIICRELLEGINAAPGGNPETRSPEYYKKRPCGDIVKSAADIVDAYLNERVSL